MLTKATDDGTLADMLKKAVTYGSLIDFGTREWTFQTPVYIPGDYNCLHFKASNYWAQLNYEGPDYSNWLTVENWKDASMTGVCVRTENSTLGAFRFVSTKSSSHNSIVKSKAQGFRAGFMFDAPEGADMSVYTLQDACTTDCKKGFAFSGGNALGFNLHACTASGSSVGFEFLGGSNSRLYGCGGSKTETLFRVRGGFNFSSYMGESELCDVVYEVGGDGLDGVNNTGSLLIDDMEHRSVSTCLLDAKKAGFTSCRVLSPTRHVVKLFNDSPASPGVFECGANMDVQKVGSWTVAQEDVQAQ